MQNHQFEACNQDTIISSQAQQSVANHERSGISNDAGNGPKVLVTSRFQEPSPTEETRLSADNSLGASAPLRQIGTEYALPQNPANTKDDTSASPGSSDQTSQSTSSTSSTLSPDVELPSPMPKPKIDEMIDKLMDEFESMFDYYLGFDIHDESVDISDTPDSDSEESDADDGVVPAMLITSPASQRSGASSTSPSSQSSILGSRAKCHTGAGEPSSAAGSSKAAAKTPARGSSKASSALGKRKIQDSGRPEDEDDDGNSERRKRQKDSEEESKGLRFACPYYQRHRLSNQGRSKMHASCIFPGFKTVARLK
ncbi:hypothetical protein SLS55_002540 [Diplodia seriata]|uniref:Uncharacterized protein n=1 Tax=Diplodia seriata TaxID=420778 RepID=A0ABR3CVH5_9PEZI